MISQSCWCSADLLPLNPLWAELREFQLEGKEKASRVFKIEASVLTLSATAAASSSPVGASPSTAHFSVPTFFSVFFVFWTFLSKAFLLAPDGLPGSLFWRKALDTTGEEATSSDCSAKVSAPTPQFVDKWIFSQFHKTLKMVKYQARRMPNQLHPEGRIRVYCFCQERLPMKKQVADTFGISNPGGCKAALNKPVYTTLFFFKKQKTTRQEADCSVNCFCTSAWEASIVLNLPQIEKGRMNVYTHMGQHRT